MARRVLCNRILQTDIALQTYKFTIFSIIVHYKHRVPPPPTYTNWGDTNFFRSLRSRIHYFVPPLWNSWRRPWYHHTILSQLMDQIRYQDISTQYCWVGMMLSRLLSVTSWTTRVWSVRVCPKRTPHNVWPHTLSHVTWPNSVSDTTDLQYHVWMEGWKVAACFL